MPATTEKTKKSAASLAEPKQTKTASANMAADTASVEGNASKSTLDTINQALSKGDGKTVVSTLTQANASDLKQVANDTDLMKKIMAMDSENRNAALDALYMSVSNLELLIDVVDARFGVPVGSPQVSDPADIETVKKFALSSGEQGWTLKGVQHVYSTYKLLPQAHLDMIKAILCVNPNAKACEGAASMQNGVYYIKYNDKNTEAKGNEGYTSSRKDSRRGLNELDMTVAHELGHCVDAKLGMLSDQADFMAVSGWEKYSLDAPEKVYDAIVASMTKPYPTDFNETEKSIARKVGTEMVAQEASFDSMRDQAIQKVVEDEYVEPENASSRGFFDKIFNPNSGGRTSASLIKALKKANALNHIIRGNYHNSPWYTGELFSGMTRQIHQGYSFQNCWYSYKNEAWKNGKISSYQFRAPCEEFAELYASYHVANPKGSHTPAGLKKWFESKGLDKEVPDDTASTEGVPQGETAPQAGK